MRFAVSIVAGLSIAFLAFASTASAEPRQDTRSPVSLFLAGDTVFGSSLYGGAFSNGPREGGGIWTFDLATGTYEKLLDFRGQEDFGRIHQAWFLVEDSLISTSAFGGQGSGDGSIWSYNLVTKEIQTLYDFDADDGRGQVKQILDGTRVIGLTSTKGAKLWSFDIQSHEMHHLSEFGWGQGFALVSDGIVGVANGSQIWSYDPDTEETTVVATKNPETRQLHNRVVGVEDVLFGTADTPDHVELLWSYDLENEVFDHRHVFPAGVRNAFVHLVKDGTVFGATSHDDFGGAGSLWTYDTETEIFETLFEFKRGDDGNGLDGVNVGEIVLNGSSLVGISPGGGLYEKGTLWSFQLQTSEFTKLHDFGGMIPEPGSGPLMLIGLLCLSVLRCHSGKHAKMKNAIVRQLLSVA